MITSDLTNSEQRLVKIIRFTQLAMILVVVNYLFEAVINATSIFNTSVIVLALASLLVELSVRKVYVGEKAFAFSVFLAVITFALFASMLTRGGLYSAGVVGIPIVILLSVLYGRSRDVLCLVSAIAMYVVFLAQSSATGIQDASTVAHQLPIVIILVCIGGYISWAISCDMRIVFMRLHQETTKLKESQESIHRLSKTDFLTGLLNAKQACLNYKETLKTLSEGQRIYFYFIDLDGFKKVNDLFDHKAGDNLLVLIADRLKSVSDDSVNVCRLSGDEFIIFFTEDADYDALLFADRVLDAITQPHDLFGTSAQITASMGIATTRKDTFNDIRKKSSMAMYQAKRETTRQYFLFSDRLEEQYMRRMNIVQGLENSLQDGLLALCFQPKVDLKTQQVNGMEALIRWVNGNPNQYGPEDFMPVIESTDLVHDIGNWVLTEACIACKQWHQVGHEIPVAVNVSAQQLYRPDFAKTVLDVLSFVQLDGRFLEIELTERFFVEQNVVVERQLAALRKAGVRLAIDDFGTGYSNVSFLMNLEADVLKLDKSFIDRIHDNASMKPMVGAIIEIARVGQMKVVAEGIETEADNDAITALGCDVGQGYYWSKSVSQQETIQLLQGELTACS